MPPSKGSKSGRPVGEIAAKVRSKNAGPFWVSVDVFCGDAETYDGLRERLTTARASELFKRPVEEMKRFEIDDLKVLKFSFPRPAIQGDRFDRDMHGAQFATLLEELRIDWPAARKPSSPQKRAPRARA